MRSPVQLCMERHKNTMLYKTAAYHAVNSDFLKQTQIYITQKRVHSVLSTIHSCCCVKRCGLGVTHGVLCG